MYLSSLESPHASHIKKMVVPEKKPLTEVLSIKELVTREEWEAINKDIETRVLGLDYLRSASHALIVSQALGWPCTFTRRPFEELRDNFKKYFINVQELGYYDMENAAEIRQVFGSEADTLGWEAVQRLQSLWMSSRVGIERASDFPVGLASMYHRAYPFMSTPEDLCPPQYRNEFLAADLDNSLFRNELHGDKLTYMADLKVLLPNDVILTPKLYEFGKAEIESRKPRWWDVVRILANLAIISASTITFDLQNATGMQLGFDPAEKLPVSQTASLPPRKTYS